MSNVEQYCVYGRIIKNTIMHMSGGSTLKPGSHERRKDKHNINTKIKHDFSSGTCEDKTTRIFNKTTRISFVFCSALGLCLDYVLMLMTIIISQAWLLSFVLPLCLCYRVNQALSLSFTSYMIMIIKTYARAVSTSWFVNSFVFGKYKVWKSGFKVMLNRTISKDDF